MVLKEEFVKKYLKEGEDFIGTNVADALKLGAKKNGKILN